MTTAPTSYDLIIRDGRVIDPGSRFDGDADVAIADGAIAAIGPRIAAGAAAVIDARGCIVTPGLIDLHVHAYVGVNAYGVDVDPICGASGVTTAVDAGSAGPVNFPGFKEYVAARASTRLLSFVAVAKHGVTRGPGDLTDPAFADPVGAAATVLAHPDVAVGIKVRLSANKVEGSGRWALECALEAGERCGRPVMVHIGATALSIAEIVDPLRPGDIVTHCYTPQAPSLTVGEGRLDPAVLRAHERGVLFDVGHAGGHLGFDIARAALAAGVGPDILSTDIHRYLSDEEARLDLPFVMTKFLALGMSLPEVVAACTVAPAQAIGWADRLGRIEVGREADLSVLSEVETPLRAHDATGRVLEATVRLQPRWTIRRGVVTECGPIAPSVRGELAFTSLSAAG